MVLVSVITTAKRWKDIKNLKEDLAKQTFKDFEFLPQVGDFSIPEGWNRGIKKARGKYILFTESDCRVPPNWIEEMVKKLESSKKPFVMGYEVIANDRVHCMSNVGILARWAKETPFNESYKITEDTEWFSRLQEKYDFTIKKDPTLPIVFHYKKPPSPKWAFIHGIHRAEIWLRYGYRGKTAKGVTFERLNRIICETLTLLGQLVGILKHPILFLRKVGILRH